ncbi:MAG: YdcF family protein [Defluviitaleaceae bacterium]|nr:YdcF family protein [Defluviitaleaceae bacterium]
MRVVLFVLAVFSWLSAMRSFFTSGLFNNNTIFLAGIAVALCAYGVFYERLVRLRWLTVGIFTVILSITGFSVFLGVYGRRDTVDFGEDVAIVLGAGLRDGQPSGTLARRLDRAVDFHRQNPGAWIVVSGGLGHNAAQTEARVMADYLIRHGVNPAVILLEEAAYSTYTNMRFSADLIYGQLINAQRVVVITSDFHMYRSVRFARQFGFEATSFSSQTPVSAWPFSYLREVAAVVKMWIIGR